MKFANKCCRKDFEASSSIPTYYVFLIILDFTGKLDPAEKLLKSGTFNKRAKKYFIRTKMYKHVGRRPQLLLLPLGSFAR